jgi:hypothetical protein
MKKNILAMLTLLLGGFWLPGTAQDTSLAELARRARDQKKEAPKAKRVFTNDDIPAPGAAPVSVVGSAPSGGSGDATGAGAADQAAGDAAKAADKPKNSAEDEAAWRKKFSELRAKIANTEKEIDIMQRELNLKRQQYYSDPNTAMQEQYKYPSRSGGDVNDLAKSIADKKTELDALKQQLSELEDDLRRAGAPAGWASQ